MKKLRPLPFRSFLLLGGLLLPVLLWARGIPPLTGPLVDEAGIFSASAHAQVSQALQHYHQSTGVQIQVLTIRSLEGDVLEDFSIRVAQTWKIGQAKTDKGLILLLAQKEREVRIEVGQGLEGEIPDALAGRIVDHVLIPFFREGRIEEGLIAGLQEITKALGKPIDFGVPIQTRHSRPSRGPDLFELIFLVLFFFFFMGPFFMRLFLPGFGRRSGGFWTGGGLGGGGFSGGGFRSGGWSGGGGGFSGGGASGRW